jgi:hypothetical protein
VKPQELQIETEIYHCPRCGGDVQTHWVKGGGMLSEPDVALIGDAVWHSKCWDDMLRENPLKEGPFEAGVFDP